MQETRQVLAVLTPTQRSIIHRHVEAWAEALQDMETTLRIICPEIRQPGAQFDPHTFTVYTVAPPAPGLTPARDVLDDAISGGQVIPLGASRPREAARLADAREC